MVFTCALQSQNGVTHILLGGGEGCFGCIVKSIRGREKTNSAVLPGFTSSRTGRSALIIVHSLCRLFCT